MLAPREGLLASEEGVLAPWQGLSAPWQGLLAPGEGLLPPRKGLLAPDEGVLAPGEGRRSSDGHECAAAKLLPSSGADREDCMCDLDSASFLESRASFSPSMTGGAGPWIAGAGRALVLLVPPPQEGGAEPALANDISQAAVLVK